MPALRLPGLAIVTILAIAACAPVSASTGAASTGAASTGAASTGGTARIAATALPAAGTRPGYAPYVETWLPGTLPAIGRASGARNLTLAFLQTARTGSCTLTWDGDASLAVTGKHYAGQIHAVRKAGGSVIPSFGGAVADGDGTDIADSCASVPAIAADYESVIRIYRVTALDMDVESSSLTNRAGLTRRSEALALLQQWAARTHRRVRIYVTLPVTPAGLTAADQTVLTSARSHGVQVAAVNIMAFDYFQGTAVVNMAAAAIGALRSTHAQLARLYTRLSPARIWRLQAITLLPGVDDDPAKNEVTSLANAAAVLAYARSHSVGRISVWALQRDNGGCPGTPDSNTCSGINQPRWAFSRLLETGS